MLKRIETAITKWIENLLAICLLAIALIVVALVALSMFGKSITGANELISILFAYSTVIGAAVAIGHQEHISIDLATERLPAAARRRVDFLGLVLVCVLNAVLFAYSLDWIRVTGLYLMPATGLPRYVAQLSIPVGCGLAIVYCLLRMIDLVKNSTHQDSNETSVRS